MIDMSCVPIFYNPKQSTPTSSMSPSSDKPRQAVHRWTLAHGDRTPIVESGAASPDTIALAHLPSYVNDVLECATPNGFGNTDPNVAAALPYSVGSMVMAAVWAASHPERAVVACSPTSGFHHAHFAHGGGFCTFNGLMVAAMVLLRCGLADHVTIIDGDAHYGDGTQDIINRLELDGSVLNAQPDMSAEPHRYLHNIGMLTKQAKGRGKRPIVFYQAGADAHIDDPLGAGELTTDVMRRRDETVFRIARDYAIPVVFNLAGGYRRDENGTIEPVLRLHDQTMEAALNRLGN